MALSGGNSNIFTRDLISAIVYDIIEGYIRQHHRSQQILPPRPILQKCEEAEERFYVAGMHHDHSKASLTDAAQLVEGAVAIVLEAKMVNVCSRAGSTLAKIQLVDGIAEDGG
ncbi:hypothetical protein OO5_00588 [Enterococcus faecalis V583]|uniref:hypothetical protein n=1 Tax=Enterococcus faecalis TaxID=1351 RepID=UPI00033DF207|nr:hypothetical protein [Enterococcus faecalis]EOT51998.1 hypothetical protein OO5_00588 [Enterococcus faecalis V583]